MDKVTTDKDVENNVNFSKEVWSYIAQEIEKDPTVENTENMARYFAISATFITINEAGEDLYHNERTLTENAESYAKS